MKKIYSIAFVLLALTTLNGCEALKSTLSGPFIGMEKDINNANAAVSKAVCSGDSCEKKGSIAAIDEWMKKNLW